MTWQLGAGLNAIIATAYFTIAWIIVRGLARSGQLRTNVLAVATGLIFFTCAVHHGGHSLHMLLPAWGIDARGGLAMRRAFNWQMDLWDVFGAAVAVFYVSLRRSYGVLLNRPEMFTDATRAAYERRLEEERTALNEAQAIARLGSFSWNARTETAVWSAEMYRIFGCAPQAGPAIGAEITRYVHPDDRPRAAAEMARALTDERTVDETVRIVRPDGDPRVIRLIIHSEGAGSFVGTAQDVTELHVAETRRREAEEMFAGAFDVAPIGMALVDLDGCWLRVNRMLSEILGRPGTDLVGHEFTELAHPEDAPRVDALRRQVLASEIRTGQTEQRYVHADGHTAWTTLSISLVRDEAGEPLRFIVQIEDVTERTETRRALEAAEQRLRVTVAHAPIGVALAGLGGEGGERLLSVNEAFCELVGHGHDALLQMSLGSIVHPHDLDKLSRDIALLRTDGAARVELELRCLHADGHIVWTLLTGAAVPAVDGSPRLAVFHALDIGERKRFEGQLQYLADHDALTGLYNRRRFEEELARAVAQAKRYGMRGAVLMVDLDGFKYVNDSMGHSCGDELVTRIGGLIRSALRDTDVVARLGGDEFAILLLQADETEAELVAEKVLVALRERAIALSDTRHARVTASIGLTTFAQATELTSEELIVEADIAMYQAKELGKNRVSRYTRDHDARTVLVARENWLDRLQSAIEEERFELLAQPIRGICTHGVDRYELLLRLRGDNGEMVPPGTFLYIAERFDLIQQIDRWVLAEAVRLLGVHARAGLDISLSVNMSGKTLTDAGLLGDIETLLARSPVPGDRLVVEVTETAAIVNIDKARQVARRLRELGCRFALDDFGAGFASFYYLKHLDFDFLKIDGEFVKSLTYNTTDHLVVQSVVQIARGLGAETIAEFVSSDVTVARLRELGVDYGQGYHLGVPEPVEAILPALVRS